MKPMSIALCLAAFSTLGVAAQSSKTTTETKITVKDGKEMNVTGCVAPDLNHTGYILTNVADKKGPLHNYMLLTEDNDLAKHVGHRLQIEGRVTDRGDAKVKVETKTQTKVEHGDDQETRTKSELEGDAIALPYMGVESWKMIAASCP